MKSVVVVGSGPIGSAFAVELINKNRDVVVTMYEVGPEVSSPAGSHVKNHATAEQVAHAQLLSQGPNPVSHASFRVGAGILGARPGTFLAEDHEDSDMPAAAMSANVGGMGAHWTCACPKPYAEELIPFIPEAEFDELFAEAERFLKVTQTAFQFSSLGGELRRRLGEKFDHGRSSDRRVQPMPLAVQLKNNRVHWSGTDVIFESLSDKSRLKIVPDTLVTKLLHDGEKVSGVEIVQGDERTQVLCDAVMVAADALRTPQLLFASGIRPDALGRYLNDHGQILGLAVLPQDLEVQDVPKPENNALQAYSGVSWIPYAGKSFPFHVQVMQQDASPMPLNHIPSPRPGSVVGFGVFVPKVITREDRVYFDENKQDRFGMPAMNFDYRWNSEDEQRLESARQMVREVAQSIGEAQGEPLTLKPGSSLHYMGTTRMGQNPADSVCDPFSKVWGFENLFVGGNGVIPTETAGNPTPTSIALAIRSARKLAKEL